MEIMIVVAIIGLLAAIAIPNFIKSRNLSRAAVCTNNMKQIASALEQICMENNLDATSVASIGGIAWNTAGATPDWYVVGSSNYIKTAPTCPTDQSAYTAVGSTTGAFVITCGNHGNFSLQ